MAFCIVRNDITKMETDAIVNTANPKVRVGDGIDRAVYEAAGEEELLKLREKVGEVTPGNSFITDGLKLKAKYIIHTVGTSWKGGNEGEEDILRSCYKSVFQIARDNELTSISIPLLASGSYGYPKGIALRIALSEIEEFLRDYDIEIYLVVFDDKSYLLSSELYGDIDSYINDNYVEEKTSSEYHKYPGRRDEDHLMASSVSASHSTGKLFSFLPGSKKGSVLGSKAKESTVYPDEEEGAFSAALEEESPYEDRAIGAVPGESLDRMMLSTDGIKQRSLSDVVNNLDKSFMEMVYYFADLKGFTDAQVQSKSNLDRRAYSKLKCGTTKNPSKATALAMTIGLELSLDEAKDLLGRAGYAFSPCNKTDLIVQFFLERKAYDILEINVALFEHGEEPLGSFPKDMV